jgi:hypothetical protein
MDDRHRPAARPPGTKSGVQVDSSVAFLVGALIWDLTRVFSGRWWSWLLRSGGRRRHSPGLGVGGPARRRHDLFRREIDSGSPGSAAATLTSVVEDGAARRERRRAEARQRAEELGELIAELAKRRREIGTQLSEVRSSGVEQVRFASENIDRARRAAAVAAELAATAADSSAKVHDRAASLHERLAADAHGDLEEHLRRAAEHRRAAGEDREAAQEHRAEAVRRRDSAGPP